MDSIVDSFFPFLEEIDKEIVNIESVLFSEDQTRMPPQTDQTALEKSASSSDTAISHGSVEDQEKLSPASLSEKPTHRSQLKASAGYGCPGLIQRLAMRLKWLVPEVDLKVKRPQVGATPDTVYRVAYVRRLVTSLSRFLATKSEVVAQVKKRLLMTGESGLGNGTGDDHDVFMYMGDVQGGFVAS